MVVRRMALGCSLFKMDRVSDDECFSVVVADAHDGYREGVARAIAANWSLALAGVAADGDEALRLIESCAPDVALLDVRLPGPGGLVISGELSGREPRPRTRVVIADTLMDRPAGFLHRALSMGAVGCLGKGASREEICQALIAAARGVTWISRDPAIGLVYPRAARRTVRAW